MQRMGGVMVLDATATSDAADTRSFVATLTLLPNAVCKVSLSLPRPPRLPEPDHSRVSRAHLFTSNRRTAAAQLALKRSLLPPPTARYGIDVEVASRPQGVASEPEPVAVGSWSARSKKEAKQHAAAMLLETMMTSGLVDSTGVRKTLLTLPPMCDVMTMGRRGLTVIRIGSHEHQLRLFALHHAISTRLSWLHDDDRGAGGAAACTVVEGRPRRRARHACHGRAAGGCAGDGEEARAVGRAERVPAHRQAARVSQGERPQLGKARQVGHHGAA